MQPTCFLFPPPFWICICFLGSFQMVHRLVGPRLSFCEVIDFFLFLFHIKSSRGLPFYSQRLTGIMRDSHYFTTEQMHSCELMTFLKTHLQTQSYPGRRY